MNPARRAATPTPTRRNRGRAAPQRGAVVLVDGSNVAHEGTRDGRASLDNLWRVERALIDRGYVPLLVVDASLRWRLGKSEAKDLELRRNDVVQAPAGVPADRTLLEFAHRRGLSIVTNDLFRGYDEEYPWIRKAGRRIPYSIIDGEVIFYFARPRSRTRHGRRRLTSVPITRRGPLPARDVKTPPAGRQRTPRMRADGMLRTRGEGAWQRQKRGPVRRRDQTAGSAGPS